MTCPRSRGQNRAQLGPEPKCYGSRTPTLLISLLSYLIHPRFGVQQEALGRQCSFTHAPQLGPPACRRTHAPPVLESQHGVLCSNVKPCPYSLSLSGLFLPEFDREELHG